MFHPRNCSYTATSTASLGGAASRCRSRSHARSLPGHRRRLGSRRDRGRFALIAWTFLASESSCSPRCGRLRARMAATGAGRGENAVADAVARRHRVPATRHGQEKRGCCASGNVSLVMRGVHPGPARTFLVRSGILDSIHAFGASTLGTPFSSSSRCARQADRAGGRRLDHLRSDARLESIWSREGAFLMTTSSCCACIRHLVGHVLPLISEGADGQKASSGRRGSTSTRCPCTVCVLAGIGPL